MKITKFSVLILVLSSMLFFSCEKDDHEKIPNEIPGIGETTGDLEVTETFVLPEGISIVGEVVGVSNALSESAETAQLSSNSLKSIRDRIGSGDKWGAVDLTFENTTDGDLSFFIPNGCIFQCQTDGYQHGLVCQRLNIQVLVRLTHKIRLLLFCLNKGKPGSNAELIYKMNGITNSDQILELVEALTGKKIDIRDYALDNEEEMDEYESICARLQVIVNIITNGTGLESSDWKYIKSLKER